MRENAPFESLETFESFPGLPAPLGSFVLKLGYDK